MCLKSFKMFSAKRFLKCLGAMVRQYSVMVCSTNVQLDDLDFNHYLHHMVAIRFLASDLNQLSLI